MSLFLKPSRTSAPKRTSNSRTLSFYRWENRCSDQRRVNQRSPCISGRDGTQVRGPHSNPSTPLSPQGALPFSQQGCVPLGVKQVPPLDAGWHPVTTSLCTWKITQQHGTRHTRASGPNRPRKAGGTPPPHPLASPGAKCAKAMCFLLQIRRASHRPGLGSVGCRSAW